MADLSLRGMVKYCRRIIALSGASASEHATQPDGLERFITRMREEPGLRILELGTRRVEGAPSTIRRALAHPSSQYTGTDFADGDDVDIVSDAHCLSAAFGHDTFDLVLSCSVYEHLARPWVVTNEIAKVLRPDGWLYVQTHHSFPLHAYPNDYYRFSADGLKVLVEDAGLTVLSLGHSFPARIFSDRIPGSENHSAFLNSWILAERPARRLQPSLGVERSLDRTGRAAPVLRC